MHRELQEQNEKSGKTLFNFILMKSTRCWAMANQIALSGMGLIIIYVRRHSQAMLKSVQGKIEVTDSSAVTTKT